MSEIANGRKVNEETFHAIIEANPEVIPFFVGKEFLRHEFPVGTKYIDFVLKDSAYYYLVEMKYKQDPIEAIIDLDKKAPLFARQEEIKINQINREQELRYHKDKGLICLIYDPDELLMQKHLSSREQFLHIYETHFLKPLREIQKEIIQIKSGNIYLGPPKRYSHFQSYANFIVSHMGNIAAIVPVITRQISLVTAYKDITIIKKSFLY